MTIEQSEITHLRALLAKATPGTWKIDWSELGVVGGSECGCWSSVAITPNPLSPPKSTRHRGWLDDAALIAAAHNALPRLLDAYEAQAAEIERLRSALDFVASRARDERLRADEQADAIDPHPSIIGNPTEPTP